MHWVDNSRLVTLPKAELKKLAKVLSTRLALVVEDLVGEAHTCAISKRPIHDNRHIIRYTIEKVTKEPDMGRTLMNLDQSKAFSWVDQLYMVTILEAADIELVFRGWITTMHSYICSVIKVSGHLSEPFSIMHSVWQGCSLSFLLYVLTPGPILHQLGALRNILRDLGCRRCVGIR